MVDLGEKFFTHGELGGIHVLVDGDHHYFGRALDHRLRGSEPTELL